MLEKLQDALKAGKVRFTFKKVDGSTRVAYGTLHTSMLPPIADSAGSSRPPLPHLQVYWDIDAASFRSFKKENLLSVGEVESITSPIDNLPETPSNNPTEGLPQ